MESIGFTPQAELIIDVPTVTMSSFQDASPKSQKYSSSSILTRFHAGYFRISLAFSGQSFLWKTLIIEMPINTSHPTLPSTLFILLWSVALAILIIQSVLYMLRCFFHFKLVKDEFLHHVGVNYLFVPWISWLLLLQSSPFIFPKTTLYAVAFWFLVSPVLALDVKIYGQWFTKGKRFLAIVANPASQMSVIANFVGAQVAAKMEWKETAMFFFSVGIIHYVVLFVTLYQRSSGFYRLPARLRPIFFLFIAAPSMASLAWNSVSGSFGTASKLLFFLSLFHFASLVCRPTFFKKSMRRFNVAWWAYSFPLTVLGMALTEYAREVKERVAHGLMLVILVVSVFVFLSLIVLTVININTLLWDEGPMVSPSVQPVSIQHTTE